MTEKNLRKGSKVGWKSPQGTVHGTVEKKIEHDTQIKGHEVRASEDNPEYIVKSDKTGAKAAHKPESLTKK